MSPWRRLIGFLAPHKGQLALALAAMVLLAATTGMYPLLVDLLTTSLFGGAEAASKLLDAPLSRAASRLAQVGIQVDAATLKRAVEENVFVLFGAVVLIKALSQAVRFHAMGVIAQRVIRHLRHTLFGAIIRQPASFFGAQASGHLVSRMINDVEQVERAATYAIPILFGDALKVLVLAGVCLWQYPELSLVSLAVVPLAAFPIVRFGKLLKRYSRMGQEELGGLTHRVTETLGGIRVVQVYGREGFELERFDVQGSRYERAMMKSVLVRALQTPVMELVGVGALILTMGWAQYRIAAGAIRPGEVVAFLLALVLLYEPMKAIGRVNGILYPGLTAAERVFELVERAPEIADRPGAVALAPMKEAVAFEKVTFVYPGKEVPAIVDLDLSLPRGKVVALVGPSGSGKSTVAALLPRLWDPTGGRITIDGTDIHEATLESLRAQIAVVAQETYLFNDTIRANILYGRPGATEEEVVAAAKAAHADGFIRALPHGYDTNTGERGVSLSGGQRQRIAIARAFLRDAPILILDEATSALDAESEREVQRAIDALLANRTALVIAHRLSTIRDADEIVVLDGGRVVERGTHGSLLAAGGLYARLVTTGEVAV